MEGWIKLHRQITEHWIWDEKPFSKGQAWIDLIMMANHRNKKFKLGNELLETERGSFITSELKLMERWGWSKAKVRAFLDLLQKDEMILKKTDNKKTALTLLKYGLYQETETTEKPEKDHRETTERPQKDTNKNEKNDKNEKNINKKVSKKSFDDLIKTYTNNEKLITALNDYITMRVNKKSKPTNRALELVFGDLDNFSNGDDDIKIKILEESIKRNWTGVFALKNDKGGDNSGKSTSNSGTYKGIDTSKFLAKPIGEVDDSGLM